MTLTIDHLETRQKNQAQPERRPVCIFLQADDPTVTPDLAAVFPCECEELLPEIYEQAGLLPTTKAHWCPRMIGSRVCLITTDRATFDVYVTIAPDMGADGAVDTITNRSIAPGQD